MSNPTVRLAQQRLNAYGFFVGAPDGNIGPRTRRGLTLWQEAFHGITPAGGAMAHRLAVTGSLDNNTRISLSFGGRLSWYFWAQEFRCKHCGVCTIHRDLIGYLEHYRRMKGNTPVRAISGTRCAVHNRNVGGATASQHLARNPGVRRSAVDLPGEVHVNTVRRWLPHGGLGFQGSNGRVRHIDIGPTRSWRY